MYEITDKKEIAKRYLKFWFWIDIISILPVELLMSSSETPTGMVRFARIGKLYKIMRLIRLTKVVKLLKDRPQVVHQIKQNTSIDYAMERLIFFLIFFLFFFHISTCLFIYISMLDWD